MKPEDDGLSDMDDERLVRIIEREIRQAAQNAWQLEAVVEQVAPGSSFHGKLFKLSSDLETLSHAVGILRERRS